MFVLILPDGVQTFISSDGARNLYRDNGDTWRSKGCMADRCLIDAEGYQLSAPTNWREIVGAPAKSSRKKGAQK